MIIKEVEKILNKLGFFQLGKKLKESEVLVKYVEDGYLIDTNHGYDYDCEFFYLKEKILIKIEFFVKNLMLCFVEIYKKNENDYFKKCEFFFVHYENINEFDKEIKKYIK